MGSGEQRRPIRNWLRRIILLLGLGTFVIALVYGMLSRNLN
jgi:hypothetical protein